MRGVPVGVAAEGGVGCDRVAVELGVDKRKPRPVWVPVTGTRDTMVWYAGQFNPIQNILVQKKAHDSSQVI